MSRAQSKRKKDEQREIIRKHDYFLVRWKLNPLTFEQQNQRRAIQYYMRISAYEDKLEVVNTMTKDDNIALLNHCFGVYDSAVIPCNAFDGCVLYSKLLTER